MDVYFKANYRNGLIYILTHMKIKNNKMLFNLRDWIAIASLNI